MSGTVTRFEPEKPREPSAAWAHEGGVHGPPPGIREVAESSGVSIGTVDRALHDRPGVSTKTRSRVLEAARALGYQPNLVARFLRSRKHLLRIALNLPAGGSPFGDAVRDGVLEAAQPFEASGVSVWYRPNGGGGGAEAEALQAAMAEETHGLILAGGTKTLLPLLDRAARRGIPVVCVGSDAPVTPCLATVGADPWTSGALGAELTGRFVQGRGRLLLVTGPAGGRDQEPTVAAFRRTLVEMWPGMEIAAELVVDDRATADYEKVSLALRGNPDLASMYVSAPNPIPVLQAIDDRGLGGKVVVITNGLSSGLAPFIASGKAVASIDPRYRDQGQLAFQAMYRYLAEGVRPPSAIRLAPQVVMRSNLDALRYRPRTEDGAGEPTARAAETSGEPLVS